MESKKNLIKYPDVIVNSMKQFRNPGGVIVFIKFCQLLEHLLQDF